MWSSVCHFVEKRKFKEKENGKNAIERKRITEEWLQYGLEDERFSTLESEMQGAHLVCAGEDLH